MSSYGRTRSKLKNIDPMSKKIPTNPKYEHVKSSIDTGYSLTKYMQKIEDIRQNYKFRKDEIFKRMKVTTFAQLVIQIYRVNAMNGGDNSEGVVAGPAEGGDGQPLDGPPLNGPPLNGPPLDAMDQEVKLITDGRTSPAPSLALTEGDYGRHTDLDTDRSTLQSVIRGVGQYDIHNAPEPLPTTIDDVCPYLLLDVRERDQYDICHILSAFSYAKAILSRSTNYESKEMLAYKNKPGKIIIMYDDDERIAPAAATTLVQRGYDNLFLLSGGLKVASRFFPDGLLTGQPLVTSRVKVTGHPPVSGRVKVTQRGDGAEERGFNADDVNKVEIFLDSALQDKSFGSRLSNASTMSSRRSTGIRSSVSASSQSSISSRPAFRPP